MFDGYYYDYQVINKEKEILTKERIADIDKNMYEI